MSSPRQAFPGTPTKWLPRTEQGAVISTGSPSTSSPARPPRRCRQVLTGPTGIHRTLSPPYCFHRRRPAGWYPDSGSPHCNSAMICPASSHPNPSSCCSFQICTVPTDPDYCENSAIAGQSSALPASGRRPTRPITASCRLANSTLPATPTRSTPTPISSNSSSAPTAKPLTISAAGRSRRWISCVPTPPNGLPKHCDRGLLHQGQRDAVAADLFVHAQTVRYRMTQLRELFGERLNDPQTVLELIVALSIPADDRLTCCAMRRTAW